MNVGKADPSSHYVGHLPVIPFPDLYETQLSGTSPVSFKNFHTIGNQPPLQPISIGSQATTYSYEY